MKKILVATLAMFLAATPVLADSCNCDTSSPTTNIGGNQNNSSSSTSNSSATSGSSTTNLSPNQSQGQTNNVAGVSNPIGQNQNIQVNNNQSTSYGFGPGIQCQGASIAVSGYGGISEIPGYSNTNDYGINVALVTPVGGSAFKSCNALSAEIVKQHQLDTCLTVLRAGFEIDATVDPNLAQRCSVLRRPTPVVIAPPNPTTIVRIERVEVPVEHRVVVKEQLACNTNLTPTMIKHLVARQRYLMHHNLGPQSRKELTMIRRTLDRACDQDEVSKLLDDSGSKLP